MRIEGNKIILEKNEKLVRNVFVASYKIFYGDQTRHEYKEFFVANQEEATKEALIHELNYNTNKFYQVEQVLRRQTADGLKQLCTRHKEDNCEFEIWDFQGITNEKVLIEALDGDIELCVRN